MHAGMDRMDDTELMDGESQDMDSLPRWIMRKDGNRYLAIPPSG